MIAARLRHLALHLTALALVALWLLPVAGLVTTSLRSADQAAARRRTAANRSRW